VKNLVELTRNTCLRRRSLGPMSIVALLLLAACGGTGSAQAPAAAAPAQSAGPAAASSSAAPATAGSASAGAGSGQANTTWNDMLAAGRKDGKVAVMGPPIAALRDAYTTDFAKDTGIPLEYLPVPNANMRASREVASGSPTFDILESGGAPLDDLEPNGQLQPIKPLLVLPEVTDPTAWHGDNGVLYMDKNAREMPRPTSSLAPLLFINTKLVQPGSIKSGKDLLDPKWKGKIVATDPRIAGPGTATAAYLDETFGPDFIKALYNGQNTVLVQQDRQAAEGVARGTYAFGIGVSSQSAELYRKQGLPIAADLPPASPGHLGGGFAPLVFVKGAPHPNAAAVFMNWVLSKAGQTAYSQAVLEVSERKDVALGSIPPYRVPKDGVKYVDTYANDYYMNKRARLVNEVKSLLS